MNEIRNLSKKRVGDVSEDELVPVTEEVYLTYYRMRRL